MKKLEATQTRSLHRPLNIAAWIIAALSLIGSITLSIIAISHSEHPPTEPSTSQAPDNSINNFNPDPPSNSTQPTKDGNPSNFPADPNRQNNRRQTSSINIIYAIFIVLCILLFSSSSLYLIMSNLQNDFYNNRDKFIILALSTTLLTIILSTIDILLISSHFSPVDSFRPEESSNSRDKTEFDETNIANSDNINLDNQSSDIIITKSGTYTFTGNFTHSIVVDAENAEVKLILDNVTINNPETAAIVGLKANKITISTAKNSQNTLSDGGNSIYDGCIYSNAELIFEGEGTLTVNGLQIEGEGIATEAQPITFNSGAYTISANDDGINAGGDGALISFNGGTFYIDANGDGIDSNKDAVINGGTIFVIGSDIGGDAGIDTDDGFTINGGTVIALGSDMIEVPLPSSKQNTLTLSLAQTISKDTLIAIQQDGQTILAFSAPKSFRTIIVSSPKLKTNTSYSFMIGGKHTGTLSNGIYSNGTYSGGEALTLNDASSFKITDTITSFSNSNHH